MRFIDTLVFDRVEGGVGTGSELDRDIGHFCRAEKVGGAVLLEVPCHNIAEAFCELEGSTGRPEEALPSLSLGVHTLGDHVGAVVGGKHGGEAKVKDVGDVINKAVADPLVRELLSRVAELCSLAHGIHGAEHQAADEDPEGWSDPATLPRAVGWVPEGGGIGSGGDAMGCFHEVVCLEEHRRAHEADAGRYALGSAEEHGERDHDAVEAGRRVHVEGSEGRPSVPSDFVGHNFHHDGSKSVSSGSCAPLGVMEAVVGFGFFDHAATYFEALAPVEVGFEQLDGAQFVQEHIARAFGDLC